MLLPHGGAVLAGEQNYIPPFVGSSLELGELCVTGVQEFFRAMALE